MKSIQLRAAFGAMAMAAILTGTVCVYGAETDMKSSVNTNTTSSNTGMNTGISGGLDAGVATQEKEAYDSTREGGNLAQASGTANATLNPNQPADALMNRSATISGVNASTNANANAEYDRVNSAANRKNSAAQNTVNNANNANANVNAQTDASANDAFDRGNVAVKNNTSSANRYGQNSANDLNLPIDARVESALVSNAQLAGTDVDVNEKNGEVTLKGKVRTEAQKQAAEQAAHAINGVNSVKNKIKVDANFNATGAM